MLLIHNQMQWVGHFTRMKDLRLPEQMFYVEMQNRRRSRHKPGSDSNEGVLRIPQSSSIAGTSPSTAEKHSVYSSTLRKGVNPIILSPAIGE